MRFQLSGILIATLILSVAFAIAFRTRSHDDILRSIYADESKLRFETDVSSLDPFFGKMNAPPTPELLHYLKNWIPKNEYGFNTTLCEFSTLKNISNRVDSFLPDCNVLEHGFFCIGGDGAGWRYAYCVHDRKVYELGFINPDDVSSTKDVIKLSHRNWSSFGDFLLACETAMEHLEKP